MRAPHDGRPACSASRWARVLRETVGLRVPLDGRVCFVRLVVNEGEQERCIGNDDRRRFHKLTDLSTLRRLRNCRVNVEQPPVDLEIDTATVTAEESAALIAERFHLLPQQRRARYPQPGHDS